MLGLRLGLALGLWSVIDLVLGFRVRVRVIFRVGLVLRLGLGSALVLG